MTRKRGLWTVTALVVVFALALAACDTGGAGTEPANEVNYSGKQGDTTWNLTITENTARAAYTPAPNDSYVLVIVKAGATQTSRGTVISVDGGRFSLRPASTNSTIHAAFGVVVTGSGITSVTGVIITTGGEQVTAPGTMTPTGGSAEPAPGGYYGGGGGGYYYPGGNPTIPGGNDPVDPPGGDDPVPGMYVWSYVESGGTLTGPVEFTASEFQASADDTTTQLIVNYLLKADITETTVLDHYNTGFTNLLTDPGLGLSPPAYETGDYLTGGLVISYRLNKTDITQEDIILFDENRAVKGWWMESVDLAGGALDQSQGLPAFTYSMQESFAQTSDATRPLVTNYLITGQADYASALAAAKAALGDPAPQFPNAAIKASTVNLEELCGGNWIIFEEIIVSETIGGNFAELLEYRLVGNVNGTKTGASWIVKDYRLRDDGTLWGKYSGIKYTATPGTLPAELASLEYSASETLTYEEFNADGSLADTASVTNYKLTGIDYDTAKNALTGAPDLSGLGLQEVPWWQLMTSGALHMTETSYLILEVVGFSNPATPKMYRLQEWNGNTPRLTTWRNW